MKLRSNKFFIFKEGFVEVRGRSIKLRGFEKYDFFVHRNIEDRKQWLVSEGKTGSAAIHSQETFREAINYAEETLEMFQAETDKAIKDHIKKTGLSPRWKKGEGGREGR